MTDGTTTLDSFTARMDTFEDGIGIGVLASDRGSADGIKGDSPIAVNGVLIPENTVLEGGQGTPFFFDPEAAREAATVLSEQIQADTVHIVKNFHELEGQAPADDVVGEVTAAGYSQGVGVVFEGEVTDEDLARKIDLGYLDVSPTVMRALGPLDETMEARTVEAVGGFRDVAVVAQGQPGAEVEVGPNPAIEALGRAAFDGLDVGSGDGGDADVDVLEVSRPEPDGFTSGPWPPGGASSVTLDGTFDGDMEAARRSATWVENGGEEFGDLSLFILDGDGVCNTNALDSAWTLASQTDGPSESDVRDLRSFYESLAERAADAGELGESEFEDVWADRIEETETMSINQAKATLADEYDVDVADVEAQLDQLSGDGGGGADDGGGDGGSGDDDDGSDDDRVVTLVVPE